MKKLVTLILALPCLAEPDSYNSFLGRFILRGEPQIVPSARLYQQRFPLQNTLYGVPIIPLLQAISGTRLSTPAAIISYQASQPVTPTLDNSGSITGVDSHAPAISLIRAISGSPGSPNIIEGEQIIKVGDLPQRVPEMHPMRGSVFFNAADDSQIIVRGFYYPQAGPDAFFWAGEDEPGCSEESIAGRNYLLAPGKVGSRDYYNTDQPILPPYSGTEGDIVLTLPPGVSARNLKWICVWCRKFAQNFGTLKIKTE